MGLAASQARLLSITQRISDNELRAQLINNQKMRLNSESSRVSENYINALNKTNLVFANYDSEDNAQNVPLTFNNLTAFNQYNNQYNLTNVAGNVLISESDAEKYIASKGNLEAFLGEYDLVYTTSYWNTIGDQLHKCEAFYSNPNLDEKLEFASDADEANGISKNDGNYSFFSADQLKEMYEGSLEKDMPSYAEIIKKSNYTDFAKAFDTWNTEIATFRKEQKTRKAAIEKAADQIVARAGSSIIEANDINVAGDGTLSTSKTKTIDNFTPAVTVNLNNYLPTLETLGYTKNATGQYEKEQNFKEIFKLQEDEYINDVTTSNLNDAPYALYLQHDGNTYVHILENEEVDTDEDGNVEGIATYWLNTSDNQIYRLFNNTLTYMDPTTTNTIDGVTTSITINANFSDNIAYWTTKEVSQDSSGITSESEDITYVQYPPMTATDINSAKKITLDLTKTTHQNMIKNQAANYVNNNCMENIITTLINEGKQLNGNGLALSEDEIKIINTPSQTGDNIKILIRQMNDLLGINIPEDAPEKMDEILLSLTSGTNLTPGEDGYTLIYGDGENIKLEKDSMALVNALVCDTMMDYFGEPIYGYMKMNGSGEYVVADEEAKWYTNLFDKIQSCGYQVLAKGLANSTDWMQFALENGIVVMEQINEEQNWQPITHTSCSDIIEQTDSQAATLAEAEYNKAMRQIEAKDEMFDLELKNIDTEHASLESEYESVKKAMTGNIERTFQMYG